MTEAIQDPYETRVGIPTVSWKYARPGEGFSGVIFPQGDPPQAYLLTQQVAVETGELLWWERKDGTRVPRGQQDFLLGDVRELKTGAAVDDTAWMSNRAIERFEAIKASGDTEGLSILDRVNTFGLRRQIVKGPSMEPELRTAVAKLAKDLGKRPVVGARVSFKLVKLVPNDYGGETKMFAVTYAAPDSESERKVADYVAAIDEGSDPYVTEPGNGRTDAPRHSDDDEVPPF